MTFPRTPTRTMALLSGVAFGVLMPLLRSGQAAFGLSELAARLASVCALLLLFMLPVLLFVVGLQHLSHGRAGSDRAAFRASLGQVGVRSVYWLAGAGLAIAGAVALGVIDLHRT